MSDTEMFGHEEITGIVCTIRTERARVFFSVIMWQ